MFQINDKVRINDTAPRQFKNEAQGSIGVVTYINSNNSVTVKWANHSSHAYNTYDLILVSEENNMDIIKYFRDARKTDDEKLLESAGLYSDGKLTESGKEIVFALLAERPKMKADLLKLAKSYKEAKKEK